MPSRSGIPATVFNYDEIPAGYYHERMLRGHRSQRYWHQEKFRDVADRIADGMRVLDVGCGPGSFLQLLAEAKPGIEAVGVDIASRQIQYAQELFESTRPEARVSFRVIEYLNPRLPFPDGSFDVVTAIEVIEHLHPHLAVQMLEEAGRVLAPGGRLLLTTPNYRSLWPLIEILLERSSTIKYHDQHINRFTPGTLVKFLETSGFRVVQLSSLFVAAPFLAAGSASLARWMAGIERRYLSALGSLLVAECVRDPAPAAGTEGSVPAQAA
jgi:ubiquinone/menaquinone biosynthesis C-methylase UbiE